MHYINGQIVIPGEIIWQNGEYYNRTYSNDSARISINFSVFQKMSNHQIMKHYEETLSQNKIDWIKKMTDSWLVDPTGLKEIYPNLPDVLFNFGEIKVIPEIETKENEHFGGKTFVQSVAMYLDPTDIDFSRKTSTEIPVEIKESLEKLNIDNLRFNKKAFIMMRFGNTAVHNEILESIRKVLKEYSIVGLRADDKQYHDDLYYNILTYMYGCDFGISIFERIESDEFNPNVSLEVGYMLGLRKDVCLLKDRSLKKLQSDLVGRLYKEFDTTNVRETIKRELEKWLKDKNIVQIK